MLTARQGPMFLFLQDSLLQARWDNTARRLACRSGGLHPIPTPLGRLVRAGTLKAGEGPGRGLSLSTHCERDPGQGHRRAPRGFTPAGRRHPPLQLTGAQELEKCVGAGASSQAFPDRREGFAGVFPSLLLVNTKKREKRGLSRQSLTQESLRPVVSLPAKWG